jgi:hypothetical protein
MVWRIHFTADDLARIQVNPTLGPLAETVLAVSVLRSPAPPHALDEWRSQVQGSITPQMRPLTALIPPGTKGVDLCTLTGEAPTIEWLAGPGSRSRRQVSMRRCCATPASSPAAARAARCCTCSRRLAPKCSRLVRGRLSAATAAAARGPLLAVTGGATASPRFGWDHRLWFPSSAWPVATGPGKAFRLWPKPAGQAAAGRPADAVALANQGETVLAWDTVTGWTRRAVRCASRPVLAGMAARDRRRLPFNVGCVRGRRR